MPSANDSFYVEEIVSAQGRTKSDALKNADNVIYNFSQKDSVLNLPYNVLLNKHNKWRAQSVKIRIAIPEGKKISFANNIDMWHAVVKGNSAYDDTYFANTIWTVENGKVKCIGGENHKNAEAEVSKDESSDEKADQKKDDKPSHKVKEKDADKSDDSKDNSDKDF